MSIYDKIVVSGDKVDIRPEDLNKGISPGLPFPQSYVQFVRRFGYGLTCNLFLIYPPLGDYPDSFHQRSQGIKAALMAVLRPGDSEYDFQLEPNGTPEMLNGLVGFSTGDSGESLFWDTRAGGSAGEYPIFLTGSGMGIRYGGSTLEEFISRVTSKDTFKKIMVFDSEPLPLTFKSSGNKKLEAWRSRHA